MQGLRSLRESFRGLVRARRIAAGLLTLPLMGITGCGTVLSESLYQAGAAAGRTALDLWLTDLANQLADAAEDMTDSAADVDGDGPAPDDGAAGSGGSDGADPGSGAIAGDVGGGETIYVSNGCAGCHCDDGAGGCALSAPAVAGAAAGALDAVLRGETTHPIKVDVSDQDLGDLDAYLASL